MFLPSLATRRPELVASWRLFSKVVAGRQQEETDREGSLWRRSDAGVVRFLLSRFQSVATVNLTINLDRFILRREVQTVSETIHEVEIARLQ
jgi:hypothetical protein